MRVVPAARARIGIPATRVDCGYRAGTRCALFSESGTALDAVQLEQAHGQGALWATTERLADAIRAAAVSRVDAACDVVE